MESRAIPGVIFAGACALAVCVARAGVSQQTGQFAFSQGKPRIDSRVSLDRNGDLTVAQYAKGSREQIRTCGSTKTSRACYELSEGDPVHVILVRDDFGAFSHVHPQLRGNAYTIHVALDARRRYYAYVVSKISGLPEQAFRFVLQGSGSPAHVATSVRPVTRTTAGPYSVSLDQAHVPAMRGSVIDADIVRKPSTPVVAPFHAAWVRAILVNTSSLAFAHIEGASDKGLCCEYALHAPALSKGLYKLWLQFDDGTATYTAPLTFAAQ